MAVVTLSAGRLDTAGVIATRTWTRVPVVLAAAGDTIRVPVPPGVGRIAFLRIESPGETIRPVVDGLQASVASISADWRLATHGQVFTPSGPPVRSSDEIIGRSSIDIVPTLQGVPTLPATVYVSLAIQEGAGSVALGARVPTASDVDMLGYAIYNLETPDGLDSSQAATVGYLSSLYQPLAANLTALAALVGAANKIAYFTGAGAMALADFPAAARTFLASFATSIAFAANVAMGGFKITGLTTGSATGEALSWNSLLETTPRNAYDYSTWTADTPTNVTETITSGTNGPTIRLAAVTASLRAGGRYTAGTRLTSTQRGWSRVASGNPLCGEAIYIAQADANRRLVACRLYVATGLTGVYLLLYTNKDTYSATRFACQVRGNPKLRLTSRLGTMALESSADGGDSWETLYTASDAAAFGAAGAGALVGEGAYTESTTAVVNNYAPYALVEA